jgi:hypothetical protein
MLRIYNGVFVLGAAGFLVACSGSGSDSGLATVNVAPVAEAGADLSGPADGTIHLDGRASYDPDGDTIAYNWYFDHVPENSALGGTERAIGFSKNGSSDASQTSFTPDVQGTFVVGLKVNDGKVDSPPDFVVVTAEAPEGKPVAVAGDDMTGEVGDTLTFDGSRSYDPHGKPITYEWTLVELPSGSSASLTDGDSAAGWLIADQRGVYVANLVVSNGLADSAPDAVVVTVTGEDNAPTANAGEDTSGEDCSYLPLSGLSSVDPDGDALQYFWEVQNVPEGSATTNDSFSDRTAAEPTFWADIAGTYQLSLSVYDGASWSNPDPIVIEVAERSYNTDPAVIIDLIATVDAGEADCEEDGYVYDCEECGDQTVELGSNVTITDADGDPYQVFWEVTDGDATLSDENSLVTNVKLENVVPTEPGVCESLEYEFRLTVTDCTGGITKASTTIYVQCCGVEPAETTGTGS